MGVPQWILVVLGDCLVEAVVLLLFHVGRLSRRVAISTAGPARANVELPPLFWSIYNGMDSSSLMRNQHTIGDEMPNVSPTCKHILLQLIDDGVCQHSASPHTHWHGIIQCLPAPGGWHFHSPKTCQPFFLENESVTIPRGSATLESKENLTTKMKKK